MSQGPLLVPGMLPAVEEPPRVEASAPHPLPPGGELGAAVAAALQAARERTGVAPPAPRPPLPADPPPGPEPDEPLDLLDTSSAPWLSDPELGVQWAESWIAAQPAAAPPPAPAEAARAPARPEPAPGSGGDLPFTFEPEASAPAEAERPDTSADPPGAQLPAVIEPSIEPAPAPVPAVRRRLGWSRALLIVLGMGLLAGLVAYAVGPGVRDVGLRRYDVPVNDLPPSLEGLRIVQVSDLHLPGSAAEADAAARLVVRARPDIVLLSGDLIDDAAPATLAALARFLAMARGPLGTFAIAGEREARLRGPLQQAYEASGVRLLTNQRASVVVGDARLIIAGFDGPPQRLLKLAPAGAGTAEAPAAGLRARVAVWMVHAPQLLADVPRADLKEAAFVVAGHTLGGTLGLPWLFGGERRYRSGWYDLDLTRLYVSNGVGTGRIRARLLAPAEVTRFTLRRTTGSHAMPARDTTTD